MLLATFGAQAESISRTISFAWDASPSAGVVGYRVHYGTRSGNYPQHIDVGLATNVEIPNLVEGTTYFFALTAYDAAGIESDASMEFVHTVNPGVLLSLSARAHVREGDDVLIAGFSVGGSSRKVIVVRAIGPSLAAYGVGEPLSNPVLEVWGPTGQLISNDNWREGNPDALVAHQLAPSHDLEAAVAITLPPGSYTAVVRGAGGATGVALAEVYDAGMPQ